MDVQGGVLMSHRSSCILAIGGISSCVMSNRFGVKLDPKDVRWAAAEGVSQDVIAAVLLLHERSIEEIAPILSAREFEKVIELVGRSPRLYPGGILEALERGRGLTSARGCAAPPGKMPRGNQPNGVDLVSRAPIPQYARNNTAATTVEGPPAGACEPPGHAARPSSGIEPGARRSSLEGAKATGT
jgi:hypothetical protein